MKAKLFTYILALGIVAFTIAKISAQDENPNLDQPPRQYWDHVSRSMPEPVAVITDNAGYDNFDLGVDFAECHISENPRVPGQFFLSYNTNATYYTMNGLDWQRNNPSFPNAAGDPITAYDSLGNLFYDNMKSPITGTWNVRSTNNGQNWSNAVSANIGNDKNWIAADQTGGPFANYIYGVMTPGNFVRSNDNGASFSNTFGASNTLPGMMVCVGANVLGGNNIPGGCVYVVTNTGSSFSATYSFYRSTNGGASFDFMSAQNFANFVGTNVQGRNSVQNMRTRPYPYITADNSYGPNRGRLYLIYSSNTPVGDGNKPDIFCRYSTDHGVNWSNEIRVNDDANTTLHNQWHPATWCDKETGRLYVQWMDTRDTPTSDSAFIYATYSTNGGESFVTNQRVSNKKFRINCTQCNGGAPAYLGDYNSIISNPVTSMLAWADFRNNNFGSYVAYFPDYALRMSPSAITINSSNFTTFRAVVPAVKLYTQSVTFTATVTPTPAAGALTAIFPNGNVLTNYPDSLLVRINAAPNTTAGNYTVTVEGKGPNGTPVHRRTVALTVGLVGISGENSNPEEFTLAQNFPNPFNPTTKIEYSLKARTDVRISVYDAMGRLVSSINKGVQDAGNHNVEFNGAALSSGVYYYKLQTPLFTDTKKMLLVK